MLFLELESRVFLLAVNVLNTDAIIIFCMLTYKVCCGWTTEYEEVKHPFKSYCRLIFFLYEEVKHPFKSYHWLIFFLYEEGKHPFKWYCWLIIFFHGWFTGRILSCLLSFRFLFLLSFILIGLQGLGGCSLNMSFELVNSYYGYLATEDEFPLQSRPDYVYILLYTVSIAWLWNNV